MDPKKPGFWELRRQNLPTDHDAFIKVWTPRIGPEAAESYWLHWKHLRSWFVKWPSFYLVIGAPLRGLFPMYIQIFDWALIAWLSVIFWPYVTRHIVRAKRQAQELLGVKLAFGTGRYGMHFNPADYESWCRWKGVVPYGAMELWKKRHPESHDARAVPASVAPPAVPSASGGWHPDPTGRFSQRYFDGTSWTAWVIDQGGAEIQDPQGAPTQS